MKRQPDGVGGPEKEPKQVAERRATGSRESEPGDIIDIMGGEIDPAEFFDPEEFGIRRRHFDSFRP